MQRSVLPNCYYTLHVVISSIALIKRLHIQIFSVKSAPQTLWRITPNLRIFAITIQLYAVNKHFKCIWGKDQTLSIIMIVGMMIK